MFLNDAGSEDSDADAKPIELKIAKQRNGAVGDIYYVFEKSLLRFRPATGKYVPKPKTDAEPIKAEEAMPNPQELPQYDGGDEEPQLSQYGDEDAPPEGFSDPDLDELKSGDIPSFDPNGEE